MISERVRWIVGDGQFLLDTGDPAAVARHIELARHAPETQRKAGATKAAAFSWSRVAKMYREFLMEVIELR